MRSMVRSTVVAACVVLWAATALAQSTVNVGSGATLTFKGFISATAFGQDANFTFGNGQNAEWPNPPQCHVDCWFGGGDIRNTRLTLIFDGPKVVGDWKVGGTVEMDFFGGFSLPPETVSASGTASNGTGSFNEQQPNPRLRLGYAQISNGSTTIQFGQQWAPLFGYTALSLVHIAFPLGYGSAGDIGWRFPGIFITQKLTGKDSAVNADLQVAGMSGSWNAPDCTTSTNCVNYLTAGNASWPQGEVRFNVGGKMGDNSTWSSYVVGHIDSKDTSGVGSSKPHDQLVGSAVEIGAKFQIGGFLLQGNGYTGHAIGQQFGAITQFGKIQSTGGWFQLGYDFTKNWGLYGFWGIDDPKDSDVLKPVADGGAGAAGRVKNQMYAGMLRWKAGPMAFSLEYLFDRLTTGALKATNIGHQLALSALYNF
jgi:hypothetical protein